jgi:hypothetical protein
LPCGFCMLFCTFCHHNFSFRFCGIFFIICCWLWNASSPVVLLFRPLPSNESRGNDTSQRPRSAI